MGQGVQYLKVGSTGKSFGKDGKVRLFIDKEFEHLIHKTDHFYLWERGQYVPYFVDHVEEANDYLIRFEEVNNAGDLAKVANKDLFVSDMQVNFNDYKSSMLIQSNELVGFTVFDQNSGLSCTITDVREYPSQTMIVATVNSSGEEVLIPFVEDWLAGVDERNREIVMNLPGGLLTSAEEE